MNNDSPDKALNDKVEEENNLDTTPVSEEQASEDVSEPKAEATVEAKAEETETGEGDQKKGYSQRVRELNERAKQAEAKAESLEERIAALTAPVEPRYQPYQQPPQEQPILAPGEEIDATELEKRLSQRDQRIIQQVDARSELRARQSEAINRVNTEASEAMRSNPELDPESPDFNRGLSDAVNEAVEAHIMANPYTASVKKIVEKLMKPYKGAVTKEVGKVTENIAKQVSETALRPTSVRQAEKKTADMSIEELENKLGIVPS